MSPKIRKTNPPAADRVRPASAPHLGTGTNETNLAAGRDLGGMTDECRARLFPLVERIFVELDDIRRQLEGTRKDLYTTSEVADATGRSEYTVRRWIADGLVAAIRVEGTGPRGRLLISRSELSRLVDAGRASRLTDLAAGRRNRSG